MMVHDASVIFVHLPLLLLFVFLCNHKCLLRSCFFSVSFASLSAADSDGDWDGKKRLTFVFTCLFRI